MVIMTVSKTVDVGSIPSARATYKGTEPGDLGDRKVWNVYL